jgi:hypothetical protein
MNGLDCELERDTCFVEYDIRKSQFLLVSSSRNETRVQLAFSLIS